MINQHQATNTLPNKYISIDDSLHTSNNQSQIEILLATVNALQQEVTKLKNTFTKGIYSYNNEATYMSSVVHGYGDIDSEEPLWAIDESDLDTIENFEFNIEESKKYIDNGILNDVDDQRMFAYMTVDSSDVQVVLCKRNDTSQNISFNFKDYINCGKCNIMLIISRLPEDKSYPANYIYFSINDYTTNNTLLKGYLDNGLNLVEKQFDLNERYYIYSIDMSNVNPSKFNVYVDDKALGSEVIPSIPKEDDTSYRVAHIAIRSCKNYNVINKISKQLVNNELIFDESTNKLYIKTNNKIINIGASGGGTVPIPDDEDTIMTNQEIIKALEAQGIITITYVDPDINDIEDKYSPSNIQNYSINNIGSIKMINEDTGKTYEFKTNAYGELESKLIEESSTFEKQLNDKGKTLPNDFTVRRGFISTFNDLMNNAADSATDRKLNADRIRIAAVYVPLTTDVIHGCSHAYVELENTSNKDYNLSGCGLHFIKFDKNMNLYVKYTLKLTGIIKAGSTYLIRGKKYIINDNDPNCFIHVNTYDQEWYINNELIDFAIDNDANKSTVFVLTYMNLNSNNNLYLLNNDIDYNNEAEANYLGDASGSNEGTLQICNTEQKAEKETYSLPTGLIDATIIGKARYGLSINKGWPFKIKSNCIYKNTFELDPAKQAYNGFGANDSSRLRWASLANDAQYLILNKEYIEFPKSNIIKYVNDYTPKASFENKTVCTDKTQFNTEKPNAVTVSFGENIYTTRCFNWVSGSNNDEYVWIYDGETLVGKFESYKYTSTDIAQKNFINGCRRKEYPAYVNNIAYCDYRPHTTLDRSRKIKFIEVNGKEINVNDKQIKFNSETSKEYVRYNNINYDVQQKFIDVSYSEYTTAKRACGLFAATNDFYTSHKCVIEFSPISKTKKEYNYIVGQADKNGNPLKGHCSEVRKFTIYPDTYIPKLYQITDQQGFHWIEYQVWAAAAIKLNNKINEDITNNSNILPIILNTGDLTQSGSRINEWLDYFNAGDVLFNHLEQNNIVGNNDLNGTDVQFLGTGDDDGKSNPYYFYLFNCIDINNFFNDGEDHYPIINNVYVPSLYYLDSKDIRFVMANSEITVVNCRDWYYLKYGENLEETNKVSNKYTVNIYTGYTLNSTIGNEEYVANKTKSNGATYDTFTPIYTLLWHAFNDTDKKCMVACHEMPFTVITHKCIAENATQIIKYRSISNTDTLIGCHMNQITKDEFGAGIYWFSRLLESSGVKLCIGGHKHTYAITYPLRENYKYEIEYNKSTGKYIEVNKASLTDGPMSMGPSLEIEKGKVSWIWEPDSTYINENATIDTSTGDWRLSEYPWFGAKVNNQLYSGRINWSKFPISYRGKNFIEYNKNELENTFYPCIPKYNFEPSDPLYKEHDAYDQYANMAVRYIMCQATGYKLKSNKELPTPRQKFSNIIPKTNPGDSSDTPSNNQLYPMFMIYDFEKQSSEIHCKIKLGRITNIFDSTYKFDQSTYDKGTSMNIEYLVDKNLYKHTDLYDENNQLKDNTINFILEYTGGPTPADQISKINVYDNYGLWYKFEHQMIDDILL